MTVAVEKRREVALARARRGAAFLDKKMGSKSWRRKIKRSRLDMQAGGFRPWQTGSCGCILAQLDPRSPDDSFMDDHGYFAMRHRLGINGARVVTLGFDVGDRGPHYEDLDAAWKQVIREGLA